MLGAVLRGATGESVGSYLTPRLWRAMGTESSAYWRTDRTGLEVTLANFNATLRDYGRLGALLAYDGAVARGDRAPREEALITRPLRRPMPGTSERRRARVASPS